METGYKNCKLFIGCLVLVIGFSVGEEVENIFGSFFIF